MSIDKKTYGFKSLGDFLVAVGKLGRGDVLDNRLVEIQKTAMAETPDSVGGFCVPAAFAPDIYSVALEAGIVRPRTNVIPINTDTLNIPVLVDSDRSTALFGGVLFYWLNEATDKASYTTAPTVGRLMLSIHEGVGSTWVSNSLEQDVDGFEVFMRLAFGKALAFYEDLIYILGTGVREPLGIINSGAMIPVARTAASNVTVADLSHMAARLLPASWRSAIWLINQGVLDELANPGGTTQQGSCLNLATMTCFGRPIIVSEKCSAMGTAGDVILADFSHYVIGDRELIVAASRHVQSSASGNHGFLQNETFWKIVIRADGQPILSAPITPYKGASTVSPFVMLSTAS